MVLADLSTGSDSSSQDHWIQALPWCPPDLVDLINSKACRGMSYLLQYPSYMKTS